MQHIDESRLENDPQYRYEYLAGFIGFDEEDAAAIHALAGHLAPHIPAIVDQTYEKLLSFDCTARHFLPRQHGYEGPLPHSLDELSTNHEQIRFRKEHLSRYLMRLIGHAYNDRMILYLDMVGKIHTPRAGNKEIDVPLVQMNALMGLLADVLFEIIQNLDLEEATRTRSLRAFQKLLWIQNDFVNRHYSAAAP